MRSSVANQTAASGPGKHTSPAVATWPTDLLATIGENFTSEGLLPQATSMAILEGRRVYVLSLEAIIDLKSRSKSERIPPFLPSFGRPFERNKKHFK